MDLAGSTKLEKRMKTQTIALNHEFLSQTILK